MRPAGTLHRLGLAALFGGATGIGFAPIFVRLSETGPTATAFYRLLFALPCLWLWMGIEQARRPALVRPSTGVDFAWLGAAGLLFTADLSIWHWSLQFTSVTDSTLITNIAQLFVTLGAWLFLGERITARFLIGMGVAIAGGVLLAGASYSVSSRHLLGDGLSLVAAVFYAGYLLLLKRLRRSFTTPVIMAWAGLASGVGFGVVAWFSGDQMHADTARGWWVLVGLALVSHVGGQTLIAFGFGHLPASFSSVSLLWQPVVAAVAARLVLGEHVRSVQAIGAVVVLLGIGWAGTPPARPAPSPATEP
jgi:drug/metabolite transporter (DMT)-like permease